MTTFTEGRHPAEFILNEAPGHGSRDNILIATSQTIEPGAIIVYGASGWVAYEVGDTPATPAGIGIAIYGVTTTSATEKVAAITRDAEVNGNMIAWLSGMSQDQMAAAALLLAANHVIVRGYPDIDADSPSP